MVKRPVSGPQGPDLTLVVQKRQRLEKLYARIAKVEDPELRADLARYACVRLSGWMEASIRHILSEHIAQRTASPTVQRYTTRSLRGFMTPSTDQVVPLLSTFDPTWETQLTSFLDKEDEVRAAVNSVVGMRHPIAHGGDNMGISYEILLGYDRYCMKYVEELAQICR